MKRQYLLLSLALVAGMASARQISEAEARAYADAKVPGTGLRASRVHARGISASVSDAPLYMFNAPQGGFAVVAGDDRMPRMVLAYSDTGSLDPENCSPAVRAWLDGMAALVASGNFPQAAAPDYFSPVAPLLTTKWDQAEPYSLLTPLGPGGKHCYTGCVATAMAQVMNYWQYPKNGGLAEHSYDWNGQTLSVDFRESLYDWANMADTYVDGDAEETPQNMAVAKLMYDCGVASEMDYSEDFSGSNDTAAALALADIFGYSPAMRLRHHALMDNDEWNALVKSELDEGRPLIYMGLTPSDEGHAFVCDGYDADGLFHINWGWSGKSDGYFDLAALDPDEQGSGGAASGQGYSRQQSIMTGMRPPEEGDVPANGWELAVNNFFVSAASVEADTFSIFLYLGDFGYRPFEGTILADCHLAGEESSEYDAIAEFEGENVLESGTILRLGIESLSAADFKDGVWEMALVAVTPGNPEELVPVGKSAGCEPLRFEIRDGKLLIDAVPVLAVEGTQVEPLDYFITENRCVRSRYATLSFNLTNHSGITFDSGLSVNVEYDNGVISQHSRDGYKLLDLGVIAPGETLPVELPILFNSESEVKITVGETPRGGDGGQEALFRDNVYTFVSKEPYRELSFAGEPSVEVKEGRVAVTAPVWSCSGNSANRELDYGFVLESSVDCAILTPDMEKVVVLVSAPFSGKWHEVRTLRFEPDATLEPGDYVAAFIYNSCPNIFGAVLDLTLGQEEGFEGLPFTVPENSGVSAPEADFSEAEIYSVSGVRVARTGSLAPGLYIEVQGGKTRKIIIK